MLSCEENLKIPATGRRASSISLTFNDEFLIVLPGDGVLASVAHERRLTYSVPQLSEHLHYGVLKFSRLHREICLGRAETRLGKTLDLLPPQPFPFEFEASASCDLFSSGFISLGGSMTLPTWAYYSVVARSWLSSVSNPRNQQRGDQNEAVNPKLKMVARVHLCLPPKALLLPHPAQSPAQHLLSQAAAAHLLEHLGHLSVLAQ